MILPLKMTWIRLPDDDHHPRAAARYIIENDLDWRDPAEHIVRLVATPPVDPVSNSGS